MTVTTRVLIPEPSSPSLVARALRAEWARTWSVRSTWAFVLVATVGVTAVSLLVGSDSRGEGQTQPGETVWSAAGVLAMLTMLLLLSLAAVLTTADHATGAVVPTLQWTPRRGVVLATRAIVVVATVSVLGVGLVLGGATLIHRIAPTLAMPWDEGAETLGDVGYVYVLGALLAAGAGLLLRSTAGTVVTVLALVLVLPLVLGNVPFDWSRDLAALLPGSGAIALVVGDSLPGLTTTEARVTLAAWALVALAAGGWRLLRTDAGR